MAKSWRAVRSSKSKGTSVTAEDIVSLKIGQVVELNRVPGEPVDLSVNGKIVARGEIVEVEGHLGVRGGHRVLEDRPGRRAEPRSRRAGRLVGEWQNRGAR